MDSQFLGSVYGTIELKNEIKKQVKQALDDFKEAEKQAKKSAADISREMGAAMRNVGAVLAPVGIALGFAVKEFNTYSDALSDVGKTTGVTGKELNKLGKDLIEVGRNSRTSNLELLKIAQIGGQMGVAVNELLDFTKAVDIFSVALGGDFSGGVADATAQVSKMVSLFKETNEIDISEAINKAGSAINFLGAAGNATSANMVDFAKRLGQLPVQLRPSIQDALALGAVLEEAGLTAEIASGGLTNFFLVATKELGKFATQMGMTEQAARELLNSDPAAFAIKFSESLKDLDSVGIGNVLDELKIGTQESIKVVGALGSSSERFAVLQADANREFAKGTSLLEEYNEKNNNAAGQTEKLSKTFNELKIVLGEAFSPLVIEQLEKITGAIKQGIEGFKGLDPSVQKAIASFGFFVAIMSPVLLIVGQLAFALSSIITVLGGVGAKLAALGGTKALLASAFTPISGLIGGLATTISGVLTPAIAAIGTAIAGISAPVLIAIGVVAGLIAIGVLLWKNWETVGPFFQNLWSSVVSAFGNAKESISSFVSEIRDGVGNTFTGLGNVITSFINLAVNQIKNFPNNVIRFLKDAVYAFTFSLGFLLVYVPEMAGKIINSAINFFKELPATTERLFNQAKDAIINAFFALPEFVSGVFTSIKTIVTRTLSEAFENVSAILLNLTFSVIDILGKLPANILRIFELVKTYIATKFIEGKNAAEATVRSFVETASNFFAELPSRIGNALRNLPANLSNAFQTAFNFVTGKLEEFRKSVFNWGANIMKAFADGLKSAAGFIKNAFTDGMNAARKSVQGQSPPKEGPFKDIDKWGFNVGKAWVEGIQQGMKQLVIPKPTIPNYAYQTPTNLANALTIPSQQQTVPGIEIHVSLGNFIGTPMEFRNLAVNIYKELQNQARANGADLRLLNEPNIKGE